MSSSDADRGRVGVVTVSYGSDDVIPGLLASVREAGTLVADVIVADNKSDPHMKDLVESAGVDYLPLAENGGYGSGANSAVAALAESIDWVLICNPDIILEPGALAALIERGDSDEHIAAVGPMVLSPEGVVYPSARAIPSLRTGIGHALFGTIWPSNPWTRGYRAENQEPTTPRDAGWLSGACLLVRRRVFVELGGFDTQYFMYFEDVDLGLRISRNGYRNVYEPAARVIHLGGHSTGGGKAQRMIHAHHRSARLFLERKYPGALLAPVRGVLKRGLIVREWVLTRGS